MLEGICLSDYRFDYYFIDPPACKGCKALIAIFLKL